MPDWGMAGRKWKRGSGEEDNWWEVAEKERQFGSRSIGNRVGRNDRLGSGYDNKESRES